MYRATSEKGNKRPLDRTPASFEISRTRASTLPVPFRLSCRDYVSSPEILFGCRVSYQVTDFCFFRGTFKPSLVSDVMHDGFSLFIRRRFPGRGRSLGASRAGILHFLGRRSAGGAGSPPPDGQNAAGFHTPRFAFSAAGSRATVPASPVFLFRAHCAVPAAPHTHLSH